MPEDISIIGFDDQPNSAFITPPLTTVRQPALEMGQAAAKALAGMLVDGEYDISPLKADLVIRESVSRRR